jgi:hypothetical protein
MTGPREITVEQIRAMRPARLSSTPFSDLIDDGRLTYRQLDHWTKRGWLRAEQPGQGSGYHRTWSREERAVAMLMLRFTDAGLRHQAAHDAARAVLASLRNRPVNGGGTGRVSVRLGRCVTIMIDIGRAS